ncbi:hypothetical protein EUGRSUZ_C01298 [Eucalyptus grandis]|uniref:Uncharacterized protein n=2 Tax=Eucalyptus grandis TaxID=71139 RepID=A0ACC3LD18_EUCGR|nr:hypothetical protein EUGRSUZ_C01298 [Eucalyptus grandis]
MASPSDTSNQEAVVRKQNKGAPIKFLVPLIYAPVLPLIRLSLRRNPVVRDRLFTLVLAGAFAHGFYLVYPFPCILFLFVAISCFWLLFVHVHGIDGLCLLKHLSLNYVKIFCHCSSIDKCISIFHCIHLLLSIAD